MTRRSEQRDANELRGKFLANRDKVRSWTVGWQCPEVDWPAFREIPSPWVVRRGEEPRWLERDAPFMGEYRWLLEARPRAGTGVTSVRGNWFFRERHEFERLEIEFQSVADPAYLAEKLALGAHAAALKGWQQDDVHGVHAWLFQGLDTRPIGDLVSGQHREGWILFELKRWPAPTTPNELKASLTMKPTTTTLDGSPLTPDGRST
ncbi:MAG TPA: hypothetical protein VFG33_38130 [Kribbella sp.]|uniref:hypothetical protein n=1 Tax=Kribbella sp. TaxID=1871183 RepID=UPI002D778EFF|nr:hypothetical protein [Kribbella sp.]HET6299246.1 hypothetical protein [Kribbella sp.]